MATSAMDIETIGILGTTQNGNSETHTEKTIETKNWLLITINCAFTICGAVGGPLLMRLYYLHGGSRIWLSSFEASAGFPILIFPLIFLFFRSKSSADKILSSFWLETKLFLWGAILGILYGLVTFMYALGLSYIPLSTSSLLMATQLCFTAFFAWLIVKQKFTAFVINAVVVMTLGSVVLGINTDGDRPVGVSKAQYLLGFLLTLGAAALAGLITPLIELAFSKATRNLCYSSLLNFQVILSVFSTIVCVIGMLVNKDFQAIPREANDFELGKANYYIIMIVTAIIWQLLGVGTVGVIFYTSALFSGILGSVLVPLTGVTAIMFYHESFTGLKGMALALCFWGLCSYFYGEYKMMKKVVHDETPETIDNIENDPNRLDNQDAPYTLNQVL
ncbi:purine permease 3-like [Papaver somniferum]|uniref:purine permease 3-like n=1 Tax=Papaver somniferum TaxID=3469 RepID=UPI000E6FFD19|nr:purine permease 3-like [Papaver somniferum]